MPKRVFEVIITVKRTKPKPSPLSLGVEFYDIWSPILLADGLDSHSWSDCNDKWVDLNNIRFSKLTNIHKLTT